MNIYCTNKLECNLINFNCYYIFYQGSRGMPGEKGERGEPGLSGHSVCIIIHTTRARVRLTPNSGPVYTYNQNYITIAFYYV